MLAVRPCSASGFIADGDNGENQRKHDDHCRADDLDRSRKRIPFQSHQTCIGLLRRNNGRRREAAAELFMSERTLYRKIKELGIEEN